MLKLVKSIGRHIKGTSDIFHVIPSDIEFWNKVGSLGIDIVTNMRFVSKLKHNFQLKNFADDCRVLVRFGMHFLIFGIVIPGICSLKDWLTEQGNYLKWGNIEDTT